MARGPSIVHSDSKHLEMLAHSCFHSYLHDKCAVTLTEEETEARGQSLGRPLWDPAGSVWDMGHLRRWWQMSMISVFCEWQAISVHEDMPGPSFQSCVILTRHFSWACLLAYKQEKQCCSCPLQTSLRTDGRRKHSVYTITEMERSGGGVRDLASRLWGLEELPEDPIWVLESNNHL